MRIAEIFRSLQGEGRLTGAESVFVRTSACNLRCAFCDTPYTSWEAEGDDWGLDEIVARVDELDAPHVVLTGGEPMLWAELVPLSQRLRERGLHITIETAGTLDLPVACDLMSLSPKLGNSTPAEARAGRWRERHERTRDRPEVVARLVRDYDYQCKFVVADPADLAQIDEYLARYPQIDPRHVWLMPEGTDVERLSTTGAWLEPVCRERRFNFCPRRHIEWFGAGRGV